VIDVAIAGGGVAGSALAILLGRAGISVGLFEKSHFPREKPCGEGIMPAGVAALERLGLADAVGGEPFYGIRYHAGPHTARARFPSISGAQIVGRGQRRLHLDKTLFESAAGTSGVAARSGAPVEGVLIERGRVRGVSVGGQPHGARLTIIADGLASPLRRRLGLNAHAESRARTGFRTHFGLAPGRPQEPWVDVFLGRGYELYVTPLPNCELLVAALVEAGAARDGAAASLERWIVEQPSLAARLIGATRLTPFAGRAPLARGARSGIAPGAVLLGDAAGYLDPITGGGISQALLTAELLAAQMPQILAGGHRQLVEFERARRALLRDYSLLTRLVLGLSRDHRLAALSVRTLRLLPPLFSHLVGVAAGMGSLFPSAAGNLMASLDRPNA